MMRARLPLFPTLVVLALASPACDRGPTGVEERLPSSVGEAGQQPEVSDDLEALIAALFPAPGLRSAALVQARNVVRAMESDDPATAAAHAMDLIDFAVEHHAAGNLLPAAPSTEAVLASLIAEISVAAGLGTPTLGAEAFGEGGAIVHVDEIGGEAVTPNRTIGVVFPPGSLPDDTVIVITPIEETGEPGGAGGTAADRARPVSSVRRNLDDPRGPRAG